MDKNKCDNIISIESLKCLSKNIEKQNFEKKLENNLERLAREKFDEARFSHDSNLAYSKAIEAYDLFPNNYQYKTYAISKLSDSLLREVEYKKLIDTVDEEINNSVEGMFNFFEINEVYSYRYKSLKYKYIVALIVNRKYENAYFHLLKFIQRYSYIDFKVEHLLLNLCILLNKHSEFIKEYNLIEGKENIIYKLPYLYVLYKNANYNAAEDEICRIKRLNNYLFDLILNLEDECIIKEIKNSQYRYHIGSKEEALFCLKYFYEIYKDENFRKFIEEKRGKV